MSTVAVYAAIGNAARLRYLAAMYGVVGAFSGALESKAPGSPATRAALVVKITAITAAFLDSTLELVNGQIDLLVKLAQDASSASLRDEQRGEVAQYVATLKSDLRASLQTVLMGNVNGVLTELRKTALSIHLLQSTRGMNRVGATLRAKSEFSTKPTFTTADRVGRKWASEIYVASLVKSALADAYNEVFLFCMSQSGIDLAQLSYDDAAHDGQGRVFSITGATPGYPTWSDLAPLFHPNSTATVTRVEGTP